MIRRRERTFSKRMMSRFISKASPMANGDDGVGDGESYFSAFYACHKLSEISDPALSEVLNPISADKEQFKRRRKGTWEKISICWLPDLTLETHFSFFLFIV